MSCGAGAGAGDGVSCGVGVGVVDVSASSIITVATSGSHMLKINGYSAAKLMISNGSHGKSCEFEAAGHTWCICYYPNGADRQSADHISLSLKLARNDDDVVVNARFRFSLVPHHHHHCSSSNNNNNASYNGGGGKKPNKQPKPPPVLPYHRQSAAAEFRRTYGHSVPLFVRRELLEKSEYLVDDCFAVRCDIDVVQTSAVADLTVGADDLLRLSLPCT